MKRMRGFTLLELMITLAIVAIFAGIAIPSYQVYVIKNAEAQAKARIHQLTIELERHQSMRFNYAGFAPQKIGADGEVSYAYDDADNKSIYVPNTENYNYKITLVDDGVGAESLQTLSSSTGWRIFADPNDGGRLVGANHYLVLSDGSKCQDNVNSLSDIDSCQGKTPW